MTKQSKCVVRPGRALKTNNLVSKITFFLAAVACIATLAGGTVSGRTLSTTEKTCVMAVQPKVVIVTLGTALPGASVSIDMEATFVASFPEAFMTAQLSAEGSQLAVSLYVAPTSGRHDVGTITLTASSGAGGATLSVSVRDGILEVLGADL